MPLCNKTRRRQQPQPQPQPHLHNPLSFLYVPTTVSISTSSWVRIFSSYQSIYIYISLGSSCRVDSAILAEKLKLGSDGKFQGPRLIELSDFDREQNLESIFHSWPIPKGAASSRFAQFAVRPPKRWSFLHIYLKRTVFCSLMFQQPEQKSSSESSEQCCSRWCYESGPLKMIGWFSNDGTDWKTCIKFVSSHFLVLVSFKDQTLWTSKHYSFDSKDDFTQVVKTAVANNSSFRNYPRAMSNQSNKLLLIGLKCNLSTIKSLCDTHNLISHYFVA